MAGKPVSWGYEADLRNFFGSVAHGWFLRFVHHRVGDPRILPDSFDVGGKPGGWKTALSSPAMKGYPTEGASVWY